ncbi:MAG: RraA family protein [Trueperaceae bacterium]
MTNDAIDARLRRLHAATICDVYDEEGWPAPALDPDIRFQTGRAGEKLVGFAYTIEGQLTESSGADERKERVIAAAPDGSVAVWAGTNARGICLFGDGLAGTMQRNGCRGMVADGGFRDRDGLQAMGMPVYARYSSPVQSLNRWRVTRDGEPVVLPAAEGGTITVRPGDWILADGDGVVVIGQDRIGPVLDRAEAIEQEEAHG